MKIIAGEYEGKRAIAAWGKISIQVSLFKFIRIQDQIVKYEIIDEQKQKSLRSAIVRGMVGSLLGPIGALAGVLTAKTIDHTIVDLTLENGKHIIVEMEGADEYHNLIKVLLKVKTKRNEEVPKLDLGHQEGDTNE